MALLYLDGFEAYNTYNDFTEAGWGSYYLSYVSLDTGRYDGQSVEIQDHIVYNAWIDYKVPNPPSTTWIIGFACKNEGATASTEWVTLLDSNRTAQISINKESNQSLKFYAGTTSGTLLKDTSVTTLENDWNFYEIKVTIDNSSGVLEFRKNGDTIFSLSGIDTQATGVANIQYIKLHGDENGLSNWFDDLYILDDSGSELNDFMGDHHIRRLLPNGAGYHTDFTPSTGSNYENVDEVSFDGDDTYNYSNTPDDIDTYALENLTETKVIKAVQHTFRMRKVDAGNRVVKTVTRINGTDYLGDPIYLGDGYFRKTITYTNNPDDDATWENADINGMEIGLKIIS